MIERTLDDTIYLMFTTRAASTSIPTALAGTPVVVAYENDSATEITAGITLGVSHDSRVGLNLITIVATTANGYEAGKNYNLVLTAGTVDGVSVVGEVAQEFSLNTPSNFKSLVIGGAGRVNAYMFGILNENFSETNDGNLAGNFSTRYDNGDVLTTRTLDDGMPTTHIDATAGVVDNVNANADMRGTDSAYTGTPPTVSDILTTQMTEAYAADGTPPTLAQAIFLIQQTIGDFAIAGTTITAKRIDGSTTAATYTLDDGTNPTSRTRTT